jgi:hypothetical protein
MRIRSRLLPIASFPLSVALATLAGCIVEHGGAEEREVVAPTEDSGPLLAEDEGRAVDSDAEADDSAPSVRPDDGEVAPHDDGVLSDDDKAAPPSDADYLALAQAFPQGSAQPEGALFGGDEAPVLNTDWQWFGPELLEGTPICMDGSATGIGVSPVEGSDKVLVFFQSGGACFNGTTCALSDYWLTNDHFDAESFDDWNAETGQFGWFDRTRENNPYKDHNLVFLPYCSGDIFGGTNPSGPGGRVHVGYENVGVWADFMQDYFWDATDWTVAGSSAGGFGAAWNYSRLQAQLAPAPVQLVSDAAPIMNNATVSTCLQDRWKEAWHLDETLPAEFDGVLGTDAWGNEGDGMDAVLASMVDAWPDSRFAFVAGNEDTVLRFFFGIGHSWGCTLPWLMNKRAFRDGVADLRQQMSGRDNFSLYVVPTSDHMFLNNDRLYTTEVSGWALTDWLGDFERGYSPGSWW